METERILLRHWQESDAEALFKYASDPDVGPRAGWPAHKSVEESREIIRTFFHNETTWAIVLKETGEAIGCIGYYTHETSNIPIGENDCEVGYWVGKPYWNKGICTEALKLMLDYCIQVKHFENIWADHFTGNPASGRVPTVAYFADKCCYSTKYFGELVKTETGRTAKSLINDRLLSASRQLLVDETLTITQISHHLGFEYPQHFVRFFKAQTGKTPSEYRKTA